MSWNKRLMIAAAIAAISAVPVAIFAWLLPMNRDKPEPPRVGGNVTGQDCVQIGDENSCNVEKRLSDFEARIADDEQFVQEAKKYAKGDPTGTGPWAFVVVRTGERGLVARSSAEQTGIQIGSVANRDLIWVNCLRISKFDPEPPTGSGPRWLQIRWPNTNPTRQFLKSEPSSRFVAYIYAYYAIPWGHNGIVPKCK
jgi:hypothetical protein